MLAAPHDLDWWEPQSFLVNFGRIRRERTRRHAANFTEIERIEPQLLDRPPHCVLRRTEHRGAEFRLADHVSPGVENDARKIQRLIKDGRIAGAHHRGSHLPADIDESVVDDAQGDAIDGTQTLDGVHAWIPIMPDRSTESS